MTDAQIYEWLDFTAEEPLGDERDDLRTGALSSVIMNMHMDTRQGEIKPLGYVSMLTQDHTYATTLDPKWQAMQSGEEGSVGGSGSGVDALDRIGTDADDTLNNPIVWENTMAKLIKYMGGIRKSQPTNVG